MKRLIILFAALFFILCGAVVLSAEATRTASDVSADKTKTDIANTEPTGIKVKEIEKETKMSATGKVTEISDTILKIDRHIKENTENMEFFLEKAYTGISIGDEVKINYIIKDNKNVAAKVIKMGKKIKHHTKNKAAAKEEVLPAEERAKAEKQ